MLLSVLAKGMQDKLPNCIITEFSLLHMDSNSWEIFLGKTQNCLNESNVCGTKSEMQ